MIDKKWVLENFYSNYYQKLFYSGISKSGINLIHKNLKGNNDDYEDFKTLEVGAGLGEHYKYLYSKKIIPKNYVSLDNNFKLNKHRTTSSNSNLWVNGDVNSLPFKDNVFNKIISTCLFHHLINPITAYEELRRVSKNGCEIKIAYPTDPGILNQFIKYFYTNRKAKKMGIYNIDLVQALEHINSIKNLLTYQKYIFQNDNVKNFYFPFRVKSWNFNLLIISKIKIFKT